MIAILQKLPADLIKSTPKCQQDILKKLTRWSIIIVVIEQTLNNKNNFEKEELNWKIYTI